jgi:hypothetical protein
MEDHPQQSKTGDEKGLDESFTSDKWMLSLRKLRYWLDLGGRDNYDVERLRKIDDDSTLVIRRNFNKYQEM